MTTDEQFMRLALAEAAAAEGHDDVPIGAIVVVDGEVVARAHNRREVDLDPTAHAEIVAIRAAARELGTWRLDDATLYVTLEPCHMCAGALVLSRMRRLVYGATDPKAGAVASLDTLVDDPRLNHRVEVTSGIMEEECGDVLRAFFRARRGGRPNVSSPAVDPTNERAAGNPVAVPTPREATDSMADSVRLRETPSPSPTPDSAPDLRGTPHG